MTDRDILQGLDFPTPCEATAEGCPNRAVSYGTCHHCGFAAPTCGGHRTITIQLLFLAALGHRRFECPHCHTEANRIDSIRFEPIGSHQ